LFLPFLILLVLLVILAVLCLVLGEEDSQSKKLMERPTSPTGQKVLDNKEQTAQTNKQYRALLDSIKSDAIFSGQTNKAKKIKREEITNFLVEKLEKHKKQKTNEVVSCFSYLEKQSVKSTEKGIKQAQSQLSEKHGLCIKTSNHHQLKVATGKKKASPADVKAGKIHGLLQLQSYNIEYLLTPFCDTDGFISRLEATINGDQMVGSHLCKNTCSASGHVVPASYTTNTRSHETCPSYWVVNDKIVNMFRVMHNIGA